MVSFSKKQIIWLTAIESMVALLCLYYALITPAVFQSLLSKCCFIALCVSLMALVGVAFVLLFVKKTQLYKVFILLGFGFGLLSCLINTPGSVPDEPNHAANIYLWSNRLLLLPEKRAQVQNNPVYIEVDSVMRRSDAENAGVYLREESSIDSYRQILKKTNWFNSKSENQLVDATLRDHNVTPIIYLPAIIGFTVARLLSLGYYPMVMLARLMMLAFYVFAASWSIKKIPVGKMTLFITALLPMGLHMAASLSYDAVILALAMMTFAYIMYLAYGEKEKIGAREWVTMLVLTILLAPCKVGVYLPIVLLLLMVPRAKLNGGMRFFWFFTAVVTAGVASLIITNLPALSLATERPPIVNSAGKALITSNWALHHPVGVWSMMLNTVSLNLSKWVQGAIGYSLGFFSIPIESWVVVGFELCLVSSIFHEEGVQPLTPAPFHRLLLLVPVVLCLVMFLAGMMVWWTPQGANQIEGIQGRYFIPMIPLVLFAIPQVSFKLSLKRGDIQFPKRGFSQILALACVVLNSASLLIQATVILSR